MLYGFWAFLRRSDQKGTSHTHELCQDRFISPIRRRNRIDHTFRFLLHPFLLSPSEYLRGSWGNHEGNRKHVCGKEEPTMRRAMVNILFAVLVIAAEKFIESMNKSK